MTARGKARKRALDILYEAEIRNQPVLELLGERLAQASPPVSGYAAELVRGVQSHRGEIDALLSQHAQGWALNRMPAVDRNVLRIGTYELLWCPDVPGPVAISEAVQLAGDLSTDSSASFVNGLLARLLELRPDIHADLASGIADDADELDGDEPDADERDGAADGDFDDADVEHGPR
jgi:transcription antitermination protein NusB